MKWIEILWKNIFKHCKALLLLIILACSVYSFTIVPVIIQKIYTDNLFEYINNRYSLINLIVWLILYYFARSISGGVLIPFAGFKDIYFDYSVKKNVYLSQHDINNSVPLELYDKDEIYEIMERSGYILTSGTLKDTINAITAFFTMTISLFSLLISLSAVHPLFLMLAIIMVLPMFIEHFWFYKQNSNLEKELATIRRKQEFSVEHICSVDYFFQTQITSANKYFIKQWKLYTEQIEKLHMNVMKKKIIFGLFSNFVKCASIVGMITYAIYLMADGVISIGSFSFIMGVIGLLLSYMEFFVRTLSQSIVRVDELKEVSKYYCLEREKSELSLSDHIGNIELRNIYYKYANCNDYSLQNISAIFKKGEKIAIVGINGAGKTTFANIIMGLYTPNQGKVIYGKEEIQNYSKVSWQEKMAAVFQDFGVHKMTISDNVFLGNTKKEKDYTNIMQALDKAEFPYERYSIDSKIGREYEGIELSVGEKQKIASARAYYNEMAEIMVIDEPTSALDPIAEQKLYESFSKNSENKTLFLITHRLSSVKIVDRIIVMNSSKIIEDGTHSELMKKGGLYSNMYKKQAALYDR